MRQTSDWSWELPVSSRSAPDVRNNSPLGSSAMPAAVMYLPGSGRDCDASASPVPYHPSYGARLVVSAHKILDPHGDGRSDAGEGIYHPTDQGAVAQTSRVIGVDQGAGFRPPTIPPSYRAVANASAREPRGRGWYVRSTRPTSACASSPDNTGTSFVCALTDSAAFHCGKIATTSDSGNLCVICF
jgi:hypothetical protein